MNENFQDILEFVRFRKTHLPSDSWLEGGKPFTYDITYGEKEYTNVKRFRDGTYLYRGVKCESLDEVRREDLRREIKAQKKVSDSPKKVSNEAEPELIAAYAATDADPETSGWMSKLRAALA